MGIRDRLRRLEDRFRDRGPSPDEVNAVFSRLAEAARARLYGEPVDEDQRTRDRDTVEHWQQAEGIDLRTEAERARQKLLEAGATPRRSGR